MGSLARVSYRPRRLNGRLPLPRRRQVARVGAVARVYVDWDKNGDFNSTLDLVVQVNTNPIMTSADFIF